MRGKAIPHEEFKQPQSQNQQIALQHARKPKEQRLVLSRIEENPTEENKQIEFPEEEEKQLSAQERLLIRAQEQQRVEAIIQNIEPDPEFQLIYETLFSKPEITTPEGWALHKKNEQNVKRITPQHIRQIPPGWFKFLDTLMMDELSKSQIQAITKDQLSAIRGSHLKFFGKAAHYLTDEQLRFIYDAHYGYLHQDKKNMSEWVSVLSGVLSLWGQQKTWSSFTPVRILALTHESATANLSLLDAAQDPEVIQNAEAQLVVQKLGNENTLSLARGIFLFNNENFKNLKYGSERQAACDLIITPEYIKAIDIGDFEAALDRPDIAQFLGYLSAEAVGALTIPQLEALLEKYSFTIFYNFGAWQLKDLRLDQLEVCFDYFAASYLKKRKIGTHESVANLVFGYFTQTLPLHLQLIWDDMKDELFKGNWQKQTRGHKIYGTSSGGSARQKVCEILEIPSSSSEKTITKKFYELSRRYHTDRIIASLKKNEKIPLSVRNALQTGQNLQTDPAISPEDLKKYQTIYEKIYKEHTEIYQKITDAYSEYAKEKKSRKPEVVIE